MTWNARAFSHGNATVASLKMAMVSSWYDADVIALQEVHGDEETMRAMVKDFHLTHFVIVPVLPGATRGGLIVLLSRVAFGAWDKCKQLNGIKVGLLGVVAEVEGVGTEI